ncbi:MAG: ABC transporter permease subunit, partial [Gemmatimonadales bacterium]|nr:ABC transporter permease subunit [Gemmatimonadales bacterium]
MKTIHKVLKYELRNVLRGRSLVVYTICLLLLTEGVIRLGGGGTRAVLSLMNVVLILVPLVSLLFGTMYLYAAREFIELLLAQPVDRRSLFVGLFGGLALPLSAAVLIGVGFPFLWHSTPSLAGPVGVLLVTGVLLSIVFTALAFLVALVFADRAKGLGAAIMLWLVVTVLYDGVLLAVVATFRDYPLENPLLVLTLFNPVDLGRVLLLLTVDIAALMGYTGA